MNKPYVLFVDDTEEQLQNHSNRVLTLKVNKPQDIYKTEYQKGQTHKMKRFLEKENNKMAYVFHYNNEDFHYKYCINGGMTIKQMNKIIRYIKHADIKYCFFDWDFTLSCLNGFFRSSTIEDTLNIFTILYVIEQYKQNNNIGFLKKYVEDLLEIIETNTNVFGSKRIIEILLHTKAMKSFLKKIPESYKITTHEYLGYIFGSSKRMKKLKDLFNALYNRGVNTFVLTYNGNATINEGKQYMADLLNVIAGFKMFNMDHILDGSLGNNYHKSLAIDILLKQFDIDKYESTKKIPTQMKTKEEQKLNKNIKTRKNHRKK